jgi:hypothetical protein
MSLYTRRIAWVAGSLILLGSITGAALVGASLVAGGSDELSPNLSTPTQSPYGTPLFTSPFPTRDISLPTQPADDTGRTPDPNAPTPFVPPFVTISGIDIPIPQGYNYAHLGGPEARLLHYIWKGDSMSQQTTSGPVYVGIQFDEAGLVGAHIAPTDEAAFAPTLDALWMLTQKVATPSPPFVIVKGQSIPMPQGSYYTTEEGPTEINPLTYIVRLHHSVFSFDSHGLFGVSVRPEDSGGFQATSAALNSLVAP